MTTHQDRPPNAPLLSVAVTSYNYVAFLPLALDSVLSQSFTDFELIVIDNASTDESPELLREYAERDQRIRLVLHDENQGALASLREACDIARGTYLVHVDADDWVLTSTAFDEQIEFLEANPDVSFVYSSLTMIGADGEKTWVSRPYPHDTVLPGEQALEACLGFNLNISGVMFRLDAYRQTAGWPSENVHVADQQLASRLCEVGHVGYFDRELYAFRQHGSNLHLDSELKLMRDEVIPMIESAFAGPLGPRIPDASRVRRRVTRNALVHRPTQFVFQGALAEGWRLYWESFRLHPILTIAQLRTVSLVSRTLLGARGHALLLKATGRMDDDQRLVEADHDAALSGPDPLVAFVHPAGLGSLGNAAIVDSLIAAVRARMLEVRILAFTSHPADTEVQHDVEAAFGMNSFSMPLFPVVTAPVPILKVDQGHDRASADDVVRGSRSRLRRLGKRLRLAIRRYRPQGSIFDVFLAAPRLLREPRALKDVRVTLAGASNIVVAGGGQLNAQYGGMFGLPYVLWRFAHTASAVGAKFTVLSVGTGTLGWPSRRLVRRALRNADYRSFRDATSRDLLRAPSFTADDPIVPDLAYALPHSVPPLRDSPDVCVGVSPMNYRHPDFHARGSQVAYEELISAMERLCLHILESGHLIVLFLSDLSDKIALDDLTARLDRLPAEMRSKVTISSADTVDSLWETYADIDVVVAVRMHAALLGHVAHRPVLAIEHERKVATMMSDMGHEMYSFDPADLDVPRMIERLDEMIRDRRRLSEEVATAVGRQRERVEAQYDVVFGSRIDG